MTTLPQELIERLRSAERVAVLTGAGVSAASGIPTFRDDQDGYWSRFNAQDLATLEAFERNPKLVWDWYALRRELVNAVAPNPAHAALAAMARYVPQLTIVTQNVDRLHQRAGSPEVLELHGDLASVKCSAEGVLVAEADWVPDAALGVPRCPRCGALLRPNVVWFGEQLAPTIWQSAKQAFMAADVAFSIGTSGLVPPSANLPLWAMERGAYGVEVNPKETYLSAMFSCVLRGPAGVVLPQLLAQVWGRASAD